MIVSNFLTLGSSNIKIDTKKSESEILYTFLCRIKFQDYGQDFSNFYAIFFFLYIGLKINE